MVRIGDVPKSAQACRAVGILALCVAAIALLAGIVSTFNGGGRSEAIGALYLAAVVVGDAVAGIYEVRDAVWKLEQQRR